MILDYVKNKEYFNKKRDYLLFSSVGDRESAKKAISMWLEDTDRNYDAVFYYYKELPENCLADYCKYKKGFKFENFADYASKNDISEYKAIWIVDDDIQIRTKDINKMFITFSENELVLGMPSFSKGQSNVVDRRINTKTWQYFALYKFHRKWYCYFFTKRIEDMFTNIF